MRLNIIITHIALCLSVTLVCAAKEPTGKELMPAGFDICSGYAIEGSSRVYTRETMYEHVNGEAELLKRYGAKELVYASFASKRGDSFTVDLIDFDTRENAFGLYRLYTGCDEETEEIDFPGFKISPSGTAAFAVRGNLFLRIYTFVENERCDDVSGRVAEMLFSKLGGRGNIPPVVSRIEKFSGKKCHVSYFPGEVDPLRNLGPGYRWKDRDGNTCYLKIFSSAGDGRTRSKDISQDGDTTAVYSGNVVAWSGGTGKGRKAYLLEVVRAVNEVTE